MLRIVHLGKYYPPAPGGIESHTQTLARAQALLGADVRVVVVNHATAEGKDVTFAQLTPTPSIESADGAVRVARVGRWANLAKLDVTPELPALIRRLLRDPPDVWHLHTPNVTMLLAVLSCPRIRPLVVTHHSDIVRQKVLKYLVMPLEERVYRRAAKVLTDSEAYIEGSPRLRRHRAKVESLPLGIDISPFRDPNPVALAHATRFREQLGGPLWLCVGRLIYYKGFHVALKALRDVPGRLIVIGTGPLASELRRQADEFGVSERVVWYGHASKEELIGAYHAATAFWFPSVARSEGFGLVQVEAMAAGCPVVNTAIRASGVTWVCPHEEAGLTVPVEDPRAFAEAANRLLTEPRLCKRLAAGGRERARAEFDWMVMGRRSLDIYQAVVGSGHLQ